MKIKYDLEKNLYNTFNEAQGIVLFKRSILRNPYRKIDTFTRRGQRLFKYAVIELIIALLFNFIKPTWMISTFLLYIFAFLAGSLTILAVSFLMNYLETKKNGLSGEIQFNKNGILDVKDNGLKTGLPWDMVDLIVITDTIICLFTKTSFFYYFDNTVKDEIIESVNKYTKDKKIIDQRMSCFKKEEVEENTLEEKSEEVKED